MKTSWKNVVLVTAATAALVTIPTHAQNTNNGLMAYLQREFERTTNMFDQLFTAQMEETTENTPVRVILVEFEDDVLNENERQLACQVALKRLEEQRALKNEASRMHSRMRTSLRDAFQLVTFGSSDETTCEDLERPGLVEECNRVVDMEKEIEKYLRLGKTNDEVCAMIEPPVSSIVAPPLSCKLCKRFVQMVDDALEKNMAQVEQVREILGDICDSMAADSMCHTFIQRYDDVVAWLKADTDPSVVCQRLRMCVAVESPLTIGSTEAQSVDVVLNDVEKNVGCFFCVHVAGAVATINKFAPDQIDTLHTLVKGVCKGAPKCFKCEDTEKVFDKIVALVKEKKHPHAICKSLSLCGKGDEQSEFLAIASSEAVTDQVSSLVMTEVSLVSDDKTCFTCDYVTTIIEIVQQEAPEQLDEVRNYADMICSMLGDDNICHQYVNKLDFVIDGLANGKKPRELCASMKFCTSKAPKAIATSSTFDLAEFKHTLLKAVDSSTYSIDECFFCTQVATILKIALAQQPDQIDQIRSIADLVCKMMPETSKCHPFVAEMDQVIDSLRKGEEPSAICHDMKFCPKKQFAEVLSIGGQNGKNKKSDVCAYCAGVVTVLQFAINQKPDQVTELREAAGIVCELLPADDKCHDDLKLFDQAVSEIKAGKQAHVICRDLKFCNSNEASKPLSTIDLKLLETTSTPSKCTTCKHNTLLMMAVATKPHSVDTFESEIRSICRLIPQSTECELLLKHHDVITDALSKDEDMDAICSRLKACDSSIKQVELETTEKSMSVGCLFCDYTAELLTRVGTNQDELRLAKKALETMCFILPPSARCDVLSSKFDQLAQLVQQGKSPTEACETVAMCAAEFVQPVQVDEVMSVDRE